jgi:hypothetical protein
MCYMCLNQSEDYYAYCSKITSLKNQVVDEATFLTNSSEADRLRFGSSPEWSEPPLTRHVRKYIFQNPDPDEGLLLFFLTAFLDLQAPYTRVWTQMLEQAKIWLDTNAWNNPTRGIPRGGFPATRPHLLKTIHSLSDSKYSKSISIWFSDRVRYGGCWRNSVFSILE